MSDTKENSEVAVQVACLSFAGVLFETRRTVVTASVASSIASDLARWFKANRGTTAVNSPVAIAALKFGETVAKSSATLTATQLVDLVKSAFNEMP